ncbi:MAG: PEP-CTERM sorting domain-containing protein [Verrucomicrobiota bacterium]
MKSTAFASLLLSAASAQAALVFNVIEAGGNVIIDTTGGTINTTALVPNGSVSLASLVAPNIAFFTAGGDAPVDFYAGTTGPTTYGTGNGRVPSSTVGTLVGALGGSTEIIVPAGYASGFPIAAASSTYIGQTFASLGMTPGSYVWTWGVGPSADSVTLNVGPLAVAIPEPSTYIAIAGILGLGAFVAIRRRKRQRAVGS